MPSLCVTLTYHTAVGFYCYTQWAAGYSTAYALAMTVNSMLATVGGWVLLFGSMNGRIARKTGADEGLSGFPLKNLGAEKRKGKKA